ncbi:MAG: branched chain amino acid aminotransferase [Thaumarchaeota archaeon]|nr:branched chain amino acid aminotransferase [Nitrososphaerota archaeon]|tara:strand:+ start:11037 stop:11951 length:915 start_codon:yes stop_codon:yes gene_type:complete
MAIQEPDYVWMDGKYVNWKDANVPILTHAMHYGTAVFEGIRAYPSEDNLLVFRLKEHLERLVESCKILPLEHKFSVDDLEKAILGLLKKNQLKESSYIRPIVYVGYGGIGLNFTGFPINVAIAAFPFGKYFTNPEIKVCISNWKRISDESMPPQAKASGNYLNSVMAKLDALRAGFDDAILLDTKSSVSEGTGENIFVIKNGEIVTPPTSASILVGITRGSIMKIAQDMGMEIKERDVSRVELYQADEVFFSGTAAEVTAIVEIDNRKIGTGKIGEITKKIRDSYAEIVIGNNEKYNNWLTEVY